MKPTEKVPALQVNLINGTQWSLENQNPENFTLIVFYRGKHCPVCKKQLEELQKQLANFEELGVNLLAVSANNKEDAKETHESWDIKNVPLGYGLSIEKGKEWGLYISKGIKDKEPKTFFEPGLFLIDKEQKLYWVSVQSMPFGRPEWKDVLNGIKFIINKGYPARGEA